MNKIEDSPMVQAGNQGYHSIYLSDNPGPIVPKKKYLSSRDSVHVFHIPVNGGDEKSPGVTTSSRCRLYMNP